MQDTLELSPACELEQESIPRSARFVRSLLKFSTTLYHIWYYHSYIWRSVSWSGVPTFKSPSDMWNYQEILFSLQPSLVIEFGTYKGGSALFFAAVMRQIGKPFRVISVDIDHSCVSPLARRDKDIELVTCSSVDPAMRETLTYFRDEFPGPVFAILDSDHSRDHVFAEMLILRNVLIAGDYLIVEDSNSNGHPVCPRAGAGPWEARRDYFKQFPNDYRYDVERERKFGFTFATKGFLIRR